MPLVVCVRLSGRVSRLIRDREFDLERRFFGTLKGEYLYRVPIDDGSIAEHLDGGVDPAPRPRCTTFSTSGCKPQAEGPPC
jgi:hypothetical protein